MMMAPREMLRLTGIYRTYQLGPVTAEVLRGVDLEVGEGELVSIMGSSGSGKTTLMNIIGLLDQPTAGSYVLNGRDTSGLKDEELSTLRNAHIGFIFQSFQLLPRLTALENVCLPLVYRGTRGAEMKRRGHAVLERVGIGKRMNHRPGQLSGGQKQRVAIARALIGEPTMLLADEPTGALDADTAQEVMELLLRLNGEQGVTILIITHDLLIARQCARQVSIRDGKLLPQALHADSLESPVITAPPRP